MSKQSAGIICYRFVDGAAEVLLVHPGGPFYRGRSAGVWSIPKGEFEDGEDALRVARREFFEETGNHPPESDFISLSPVRSKSGKWIHAWAAEGDIERPFIRSNTFTLEWPPKSGKRMEFPEVDDARWFPLPDAEAMISPSQVAILQQLRTLLPVDGRSAKM